MRIKNLAKTKRRYATILADPPWSYYGNREKTSDQELNMWRRKYPYGSMKLSEIQKLPVERIAAEDAILWLWTTNAMLQEGLDVLDAWGFKYVGVRTWVKPKIGIGYWLRGQTEQLLLGIHGKPNRQKHYNPAAINKGISTLLAAPTNAHSSKPPESYRDIERMSKPPRIELFARRAREGWDSWGREAKGMDMRLERDIEKYL